MIFMIIMFSGVFGFVMADQQVPQLFAQAIINAKVAGWVFMLITIGLFFILGFVMGSAAITIIVIPILVPLLEMYHYSLIQFGVVSTTILETAFLTPPVGTVLYVIARVCKVNVEQVIKGVWPFIIIILIMTLIFAFVPGISLMFVRNP